MLIANTFLRHLLVKDKNFSFLNSKHFENFKLYEQLSFSFIKENPRSLEIYLNTLSQVFDNQLPDQTLDGKEFKHLPAFSLNNVSKMALATLNILPGTWLGVGQVSHLLKRLNSLFRPLCDDFQVCVLNDGYLWFKKIAKKMKKVISVEYKSKNLEKITDKEKRQRKYKDE